MSSSSQKAAAPPPSLSKLSMEHQLNRASIFAKVVNSQSDQCDIDFDTFRQMCFRGGIPDTPGIRPVCYKLLFKYIPFEMSKRTKQLEDKRNLYFSYVEEFCSCTEKPAQEDETFEQIDKDVRRTLSDFGFFHNTAIPLDIKHRLHPKHPQSLYKPSRLLFHRLKNIHAEFGSRSHSRQQQHHQNDGSDIENGGDDNCSIPSEDFNSFTFGFDFHWEVIERILYIYTKLNPGIGYVQGMNELLGPIYYVFATDSNGDSKLFAEPDAFWVFFALMSEMKDLYMKSMDIDKVSGINANMTKLYNMLELHEPELWQNLQDKSLHPAYFSFRWLSLLLAQEFDLPDLIRLWDSMFSDKNRFQHVKNDLMLGSFHDNVKLLQNYPLHDLNSILKLAYKLYDEEVVDQLSKTSPVYSSPSPKTSPKSPIEELAGLFSPALQSLSSALTGFTKTKTRNSQ